MGLMDRDYWKEKQNKDAIYNPKEFRGDYNEKSYKRRPQKSKLINFSLIALTILALLISSLVEKGFRYKDFHNFISNSKETIVEIIGNPTKAMNDILTLQKSNLDIENKNQLLVDDTNKRININIIPTHVTEVQTNFKTKVEGIKFNFTYTDYLANAKDYFLSLNYWTSLKDTYGSISIKPLKCDSQYQCKVRIKLDFWGSIDSNLGLNSSYDTKPCEGKFAKGKYIDDGIECTANIGTSITQNINIDLNKPINFNVEVKDKNLIVSFIQEDGSPNTIGEFILSNKFEIQKSVVSSIYFGEKISGCEMLKPIHASMGPIINTSNNEKGSAFRIDRFGDEHPCSEYSKSKILKDKIILMVEK